MSNIDTSKLTDDQKKALAQVDAALAMSAANKTTKKKPSIIKVIVMAVFFITVIAMTLLVVQIANLE
jgi:hypothetical protein